MLRTMLSAKIHRATVTTADVDYVGSLTVDTTLLEAAGILPGELVHVVDVTNGVRLQTYVIEGAACSGVIGVNGAAAHLISPGDLVIVMAFVTADEREARELRPRVVHVDSANRIVSLGEDPAAPVPGSPSQRRPPHAVPAMPFVPVEARP